MDWKDEFVYYTSILGALLCGIITTTGNQISALCFLVIIPLTVFQAWHLLHDQDLPTSKKIKKIFNPSRRDE